MINSTNIENSEVEVVVSKSAIKILSKKIIENPAEFKNLLNKYHYNLPQNYSLAQITKGISKAITDGNPGFIKELNAKISGGFSSVDPITLSAIIGG